MTYGYRRYPLYDPAANGWDVWLDPSDSSTASLKNTGGTGITNGATVGQWISKAGSARIWQQFAAVTRPTWTSSGINGLGSVSYNGSMALVANTLTGMASMPGFTILTVEQNVNATGVVCGVTVSHDTGNADTLLVNIPTGRPLPAIGGRRVQADSFVSSGNGTAVNPGVTNLQGGIFDYANAKLSYTQNGVLVSRQIAFQAAGNTSATLPFAFAMGNFIIETGPAASSGYNGLIGETLIAFSAKTIDQVALAAAYLRKKWRTPW